MKAGMRDTNWYYRTESNRLLPVSTGALPLSYSSICLCLDRALLYSIAMYGYVLYATLKCVAYVYISIYKRTPTFSGTPGGVRPTKNRASAGGNQGPAARRHRPAARRRPYWAWTKRSCPSSAYRSGDPRPETRILSWGKCRIIKVERNLSSICPHTTD